MQVDLRILRFDPERDPTPHWERYTVESRADGPGPRPPPPGQGRDGRTLTFRRSCAHGICGSDAMLINGRNRLACKIRVDQLGKKITVAPLTGLPVVKDLVVDMEGFFAKYRSAHAVPRQRLAGAGARAPPERRRSRPATTTRRSASCARPAPRSCPSFWAQPSYVGPAAIVNAHRFIFDSRDEAADERLEILADKDGVWRCRTIFNCVDACPRDINITRAILEVSRAIVERSV